MKFFRHGTPGAERPGMLDPEGRLRDLSGLIDDLGGAVLDPDALAELGARDIAALPLVDEAVRIGPCVAGTRHFLAIGLNYADHAAETGMPTPQEPIVFNKAPNCIAGPYDAIPVPPGATKVDWEVELALVIGRRAWQVSEADALGHLAGYCICNDVSERAWQLEGTGQWLKGKSAPGFGPLGPWLVTPDEVPDPLSLAMALEVNGETMQSGSTATMIFGPAFLVSYLSRFMVLEPGDVITTGTPPGVGMARGRFLKPGDRVRAMVAGLGEQVNEVV